MLCFIHIERAGGTTLEHILRNNYLSFLTLPPSVWTNDPAAVFTADELRALVRWLPFTRGFGGHTTRVYGGYEEAVAQPIKYFTFLRDPVERYVSHFHYQVDTVRVPWSLDAFLHEPRFANFMTNRIAGGPDLARAKELLQTRFDFVGLTERFDESLLLMRNALGRHDLEIHYEQQNVGRHGGSSGKSPGILDDPDALEQIRSRNRLDLELHEFVRNAVYPGYVDRYGPGLESDVDRFRRENAGFRFSRRRRLAWALYRKVVYEPMLLAVTGRRRRHPH